MKYTILLLALATIGAVYCHPQVAVEALESVDGGGLNVEPDTELIRERRGYGGGFGRPCGGCGGGGGGFGRPYGGNGGFGRPYGGYGGGRPYGGGGGYGGGNAFASASASASASGGGQYYG